MADDAKKERERLSQAKFLKLICQDFEPTDLIPAYWSVRRPDGSIRMHCALIPNAKVEKVLSDPTWDLMIGRSRPDVVECREAGGEAVMEYLRFGDDTGIEPLVFYREFHGLREPYVEVSEDFRLYHNLHHDRGEDKYIKIDDAGNETEVIVVQRHRILIRLYEIKQFLAAKDMHLALYFDNREQSLLPLKELGIEKGEKDVRDGLTKYCLTYGGSDGLSEWQGFSRLLGKRLFPPYPIERSGLWRYAREEPAKLVDFIIGVDEKGNEVLSGTDSHGDAPEYLTPVFFRRTVLDKYYQQPNKYSVEDGYLGCGSLWGMDMDNHHDEYVVAWLGDLGRDLPYEEQLRWRSFNVPACGPVSEVFFKRQVCAEFADSDQPDIQFKDCFPEFCARCVKKLGWSLFLPLAEKDRHYFDTLRIPASNEQKEFDDLVLGLAKVLVDSLNEKQLTQLIPPDQHDGLKGSISRLERVLASSGQDEYRPHIQFLRDLQDLRSSGSAHRKGAKYKQVAQRFTTETEHLPKVFRGVLARAVKLIDYLEKAANTGVFSSSTSHPT